MVDYLLLSQAIFYYEKSGYTNIDVPWLVTPYVDYLTKPADLRSYEVVGLNKNLIASGEQGFLYLYLKNHLPKGTFQTTTPCFRGSEVHDLFHQKYFMKTELINTLQPDVDNLDKIIGTAFGFFSKHFDKNHLSFLKTGDQSYDILYKEIELGSYGIRECPYLKWIYGTGIALPRMSKALLF
jgi:hypothetical protein